MASLVAYFSYLNSLANIYLNFCDRDWLLETFARLNPSHILVLDDLGATGTQARDAVPVHAVEGSSKPGTNTTRACIGLMNASSIDLSEVIKRLIFDADRALSGLPACSLLDWSCSLSSSGRGKKRSNMYSPWRGRMNCWKRMSWSCVSAWNERWSRWHPTWLSWGCKSLPARFILAALLETIKTSRSPILFFLAKQVHLTSCLSVVRPLLTRHLDSSFVQMMNPEDWLVLGGCWNGRS